MHRLISTFFPDITFHAYFCAKNCPVYPNGKDQKYSKLLSNNSTCIFTNFGLCMESQKESFHSNPEYSNPEYSN